MARRAVDAGASSIGLADTIGVAVPTEVAVLVGLVRSNVDVPIGVHLHDTRGLAIANAIAALEHGAVRLDASVGGLGGCPFAPDASGNVPIEDLAHALDAMGVATGVSLDGLVDAATLACERGRAAGRQPHRSCGSPIRPGPGPDAEAIGHGSTRNAAGTVMGDGCT